MECDVIIVGGGPAGLAFARSLDDAGLDVVIVERQPEAALAEPAFDGREIALTQHSIRLLKGLGAWDFLKPEDVAPLRKARVLNGASPFALTFDPGDAPEGELGMLVPNHRIRASLYDALAGQAGVRLLAGRGVTRAEARRDAAEVELDNGETLRGRLLVAADSRFSFIRDQLGISAEINRLQRSMMVVRVRHERDHQGIATEWFDHHQTFAMLPLNGNQSSAVLTLPAQAMEAVAALDDAALGAELTRRYSARLGRLEVASSHHVYPLATTWSRHFAATRAALIGDAAVGMHPVTAHGFNLGLSGQAILAAEVREAKRRGRDIGGTGLLRRFERAHRTASWPLYAGTNLIVRVYTDESMPARVIRHAGLRLGARLPLVRQSVRTMLMAR